MVTRETVVFVQIKGDDIGKTEFLLLMTTYQLPVKAYWCRSRCQTQHSRLALCIAFFDQLSNAVGYMQAGAIGIGVNSRF